MSGSLTLAEANSILAAAITKARELNILVSVTVCDNRGHLIALNRMDGAFSECDRLSIGKALASAGAGLPSGQIGMIDHPSVELVVAQGMTSYRVRGGLPIFRDGQVAGGCGVAGAPSSHEEEEECARAGIASLPS
jgi:glc operon protein GlcG